jgi:hypothetical protein
MFSPTQGNQYVSFHNAIVLSLLCVYVNRELENEGFMVVINVAGAEQRVNLSIFPTLNGNLTVALAAPNSRFSVG